MRQSKFTKMQIVVMLKDAENGIPVANLIQKNGASRPRSLSGAASTAGPRFPM